VEIPTGHNLRTSQEAIAAFKLIAGYLYRQAFSEEIVPVEPDREELLRVIACERERVSADGLSMRSYWQGYLSGSEENGWGYDFYKNFPEFRDFLAEECALARADSGDRIADLGCGTGLLLETLLEGLARQEREIEDLQIVAVDLVQEALDKARAKCEALTGAHRSLSDVQMRYLRMDLNPNRLIPVQRYLQDPRCGYDSLRNKVAGLRNATIDLMIEKDCPALREAMCGEPLGEASRSALSSILYDGHLQAVLDFNRAARFLRRNLNGEDLVPGTDSEASGTLPESAYGRVNSRHLKLQALDFADSDLSLALPFGTGAFTTIVASLFISYLRNPELLFPELYRILAPGGKLIVSALRPDSDLSSMYTRFVGKMKRFELEETRFGTRDENLKAARAMLNEAAGLMCLEEDGVFAFHSEEELLGMFQSAGFCDLQVRHSLGNPPQAIIVTGARR
jgi:SAM-dependent methyltransferase